MAERFKQLNGSHAGEPVQRLPVRPGVGPRLLVQGECEQSGPGRGLGGSRSATVGSTAIASLEIQCPGSSRIVVANSSRASGGR